MSKYREQLTRSDKELMRLYRRLNEPICYYCGKYIENPNEVTVDHKVPASRGGDITNFKNFAIACLDCNQEKKDMTEEEYYEYKKQRQELFNSDTISINILKIPKLFIMSPISDRTRRRVLSNYNKYNYFQPIVVKHNMYLSDGYTTYCIAKELGIYELQVVFEM